MIPHWIGIQKIDNGRIVECTQTEVVAVIDSDCSEPLTCGKCHSHNSCASAGISVFCRVSDVTGINVHPGERVRIKHFIVNKSLAALLLFGGPILLTFVAVLVQLVMSGNATESVWTVVAAVFGLLFGFILVAFFDQGITRLCPKPQIVVDI